MTERETRTEGAVKTSPAEEQNGDNISETSTCGSGKNNLGLDTCRNDVLGEEGWPRYFKDCIPRTEPTPEAPGHWMTSSIEREIRKLECL